MMVSATLKMIRTVSRNLVLLQLLVVVLATITQHCCFVKGFSSLRVIAVWAAVNHNNHQQSTTTTRLAYGQLSSDAATVSWQKLLRTATSSVSSDASNDADDADEDDEAAAKQEYDTNLFVTAAIPPILAFICYGEIARSIAYFFDLLGFNGVNVDGNAFATNLLRPTLNGVVVPATGIGLGTLFATTVNVLWNRQLRLRSTINKEVCELRLLRRAIFGCFGTIQHSKRRAIALGLLHNYTRTLMSETQTADSIEQLEDIQNSGGISMNELDELAEMLHGVDGAAASRQSSVAKAGDLLISLNAHRSERVAITLSGFPRIHWLLLDVLYLCIVLSFLIDSNQEVNQYLNSIQLRVLFAIIVSTGSGAAMLLKDLEDPFQGTFCINLASKQLGLFEELLVADIAQAEDDHKQVGPSALITLDRGRQRPNYNAGNTVYLHLLTGPLAANIKFLGDILAWTFGRITRSWSTLKKRFWRWGSRRSHLSH